MAITFVNYSFSIGYTFSETIKQDASSFPG